MFYYRSSKYSGNEWNGITLFSQQLLQLFFAPLLKCDDMFDLFHLCSISHLCTILWNIFCYKLCNLLFSIFILPVLGLCNSLILLTLSSHHKSMFPPLNVKNFSFSFRPDTVSSVDGKTGSFILFCIVSGDNRRDELKRWVLSDFHVVAEK